jgi:hypothetical protein
VTVTERTIEVDGRKVKIKDNGETVRASCLIDGRAYSLTLRGEELAGVISASQRDWPLHEQESFFRKAIAQYRDKTS